MAIVLSCAVFLVLAIVLSLVGMKMYIRPREAMERVAGTVVEHHEAAPTHPSLVFRDFMKRLGNVVPASPKDVTVMQKRLIRAGFRQGDVLVSFDGRTDLRRETELLAYALLTADPVRFADWTASAGDAVRLVLGGESTGTAV